MEAKDADRQETDRPRYIARLGEVPRQNRPQRRPMPAPKPTPAPEQPNEEEVSTPNQTADAIQEKPKDVSETEAAAENEPTTEVATPRTVTPNGTLDPNPLRPPQPRPQPSTKPRDTNPKTETAGNAPAPDPGHEDAETRTADEEDSAAANTFEQTQDESQDDREEQTDKSTSESDTNVEERTGDESETEQSENTETEEDDTGQTDDATDTKQERPRKDVRRATPKQRKKPKPKPKTPAREPRPSNGLPLVPTVIVTFLLGVVLTLAAVFLAKGLLDSRESRQAQTTETPAASPAEVNGSTPATTPEPSQNETKATETKQIADATQVATKCLPSVVSIRTAGSKGNSIASGVIIDDKGHVITNWHVIEDADRIGIDAGDEQIEAKLVGGDKSSDVAVIQADLSTLEDAKPIEVGDSSELKVGDWVMTLGSPLGLEKSASAGIVSALSRNTVMSGSGENTVYVNLIQVDAAINSGNSGGALVNDKGQLVGINTLYANGAGDEAFAGIGFAIPGNFADDIAQKVIAGETITHAYIGLSCSTINSQSAKASGVSATHGAYVAEIVPDAPGAQAGIAIGDVITKIGDTPISSADDYILAIRSHEPGEVVDIVIDRQGNEVTAQVTLGSDDQAQRLQDETK